MWLVGLDEAGYGPNLGPLVQASTAFRVADDNLDCLWQRLASVVRKKADADDGRLIVDDSKKVNEGKNGLARLQRGLFAFLGQAPATLGELIEQVGIEPTIDDLQSEAWYKPDGELSSIDDVGEIESACREAGIEIGPIKAIAVPAPRFNELLRQWNNKAGALAAGVIALLRQTLSLPGDDPVSIAVDKLGGRHFYLPLINEAFSDGWTRAVREGPDCCEYIVYGLGREVRMRFEPKADGAHFGVALASMTAKFVREACMAQFNAYWTDRVPGLKPTAGYPVDAARFFAEIRPILDADGQDRQTVWRMK